MYIESTDFRSDTHPDAAIAITNADMQVLSRLSIYGAEILLWLLKFWTFQDSHIAHISLCAIYVFPS